MSSAAASSMLSKRTIAIAAFVAAVGGIVAGTDHPAVRYMEDRCAYEHIYLEDGPVDVVTFGSSHAVRAIGADELADAMSRRLGHPVIAWDLSRSQRGMGHTFVMVRDLLSRHDVGHVVVEYNQRHRLQAHSLYYVKARLWDFVRDLGSEPEIPILERVARVLRWTMDRVTYRIEQPKHISKYVQALMPDEHGMTAATHDCSKGENAIEQDELFVVSSARREVWREPSTPSWEFDQPEENRNSYFVERIIELCHEHGSSVVFAYYPRFYQSRWSDDFTGAFERRFGVPLIQPPNSLLERVYTGRGYADSTHMTLFGRELLMEWLADELTAGVR